MSFWLFYREVRARVPVLDSCHEPDGVAVSLALPADVAGSWCRLRATVRAPGPFWVKLELVDEGPHPIVRQRFLGPARGRHGRAWRETLVYVPRGTSSMNAKLFGRGVRLESVSLDRLSRAGAALRLLWQGRASLPGALRGDATGLAGRARTVLGQAPARRGEAPPYNVWLELYGHDGRQMPANDPDSPRIQLVVIEAREDGAAPRENAAAMAATLASIGAQTLPAAHVITVYKVGDWAKCLPGPTAFVQAGEILHPGALARLARAARAHPAAGGIYADLDEIDARGTRHTPHFKPGPDPLLLSAGLLTRGVMLFPGFDPAGQSALHAEEVRLSLALAQGAARLRHVPALLTHRGWNTAQADAPFLARLAAERAIAGAAPPDRAGHALVSIIVPSTGRSAHMLRCLRRVVRATHEVDFEILLAVTRIDPGDRRQAAILRQVSALPHTRVLDLGMDVFNYAAANNVAAAAANGSLLLLLNDDVAPIGGGWLRDMIAFLADPGVGIVGARLLYGNGSVQHGGVLLGLAGLCEHIDRGRPAGWRDPCGMALQSRAVSAVTAACLLVRRDLFEKLQGLDEMFAIALNDVDFCLRAGAAGKRTVYAANAVLYHYESLSLGRHYAGVRAALERREISLLQQRWPDAIADDPFYNCQASLEPGREWQPGFPPRPPGGDPAGCSDADYA